MKSLKLIPIVLCFLVAETAHAATRCESGFGISQADRQSADAIAREAARWFQYTTGPMGSAKLGQCGDYALRFILNYNRYAGANVARLVTTNNPILSGTYRVGVRTDVAKLGFHGFATGASGFLNWRGQLYLYHPVLGAYPLFLEERWIPKFHFGVDMLDKKQVHTWASVGDLSVDPTYFALWPDKFPTPLGFDQR